MNSLSWLILALVCIRPVTAPAESTPLAELDLGTMTSGWGRPQADCGVSGESLAIGGQAFGSGIGTHAPSSWKLALDGKASEFHALVGVNDGSPGRLEFVVRGDGKDLFRSGPLRGGDAAKPVRVNLVGVRQLELYVDPLGEMTSDHADWIDPVIVHTGAPLPSARPSLADAPVPDQPGDPANAPARTEWDAAAGTLRLFYDGKLLFDGRVSSAATLSESTNQQRQAFTQMLTLRGRDLRLTGIVNTGDEAIAAETRGAAQEKFPLIRTTIGGPSRNSRNNAVYDRSRDWVLAGASQIEPRSATDFSFVSTGNVVELTFRPRYYQRHKNIAYFRPWTYRVRQDSITGWSSWWAFMRKFNQRDLEQLLAVWQSQHFADYGYRFIQIDDCYQGGEHAQHRIQSNYGYEGGHPQTWLVWRKDLFPGGLGHYAATVRQAGFEPAIWVGSFFSTADIVEQHPDWFVRGTNGKPFMGPWVGYAMDASDPQVQESLIRPTYRGLQQAGISYVKIDQLRHYLYDNLNRNSEYCRQRGLTSGDLLRLYLHTARQELGPEVFLLSCWGVLPEAVGLADACRIGGDGYGPVTMQQYNSWNGIVWRNDPDHCDVRPHFKPAETGNVTRTSAVQASSADTLIRPALASLAGCLLMLSDQPAVYQDSVNLVGLRRAAPVLFSVPGQLYDFDESKSRKLITVPRSAIDSGAKPAPIDAAQFGPVCPWWLNEFVRPFEQWNVLHRLNWADRPADPAIVHLADLGLDPSKSYLVYEFWSRQFLGAYRGQIELPALGSIGIASYAIREQLGRPQIVSTSRHLSQGGVDLVAVNWQGNQLRGHSQVVIGDRYELALHVPAGFTLKQARFGNQPAEISTTTAEVVRVAFTPAATGATDWSATFEESSR